MYHRNSQIKMVTLEKLKVEIGNPSKNIKNT
jgi:hypothetical protein